MRALLITKCGCTRHIEMNTLHDVICIPLSNPLIMNYTEIDLPANSEYRSFELQSTCYTDVDKRIIHIYRER